MSKVWWHIGYICRLLVLFLKSISMYMTEWQKVMFIWWLRGLVIAVIISTFVMSWQISNLKSKMLKVLTGEGDWVYYAGNIDERIREIEWDIMTMWQWRINQIYDAVVEKPVVDDKDRELCDEGNYPAYLWNCYREDIKSLDLINSWMPKSSEIKCEWLYLYHQLDERSEDWRHIAYEKVNWDERAGWFDYEYLVENCKSLDFD